MAKTYKNIQDNVLRWIADVGDVDHMLEVIKLAINQEQMKILTAEQFDFMLIPKERTLSLVIGQEQYSLPDNWQQGLYIKNANSERWMEEIPIKGLIEAEDGLMEDQGHGDRFSITTVQSVQAQPTATGTVVVTPVGGTELAANGIVLQGLNGSGEWIEETLSSGTAWSSLTSSNSFSHISNVIKTGSTWTRTIGITRGVTILTLLANEYVKQYQQLELVRPPVESSTWLMRYYVKPIPLVYDHQLSQIPDSFVDILEYGALLRLHGYAKPTDVELKMWSEEHTRLLNQMRQVYQQARTIGSRARRVTFVDRI